MFVVKPVQDKALQESLAQLTGCEYHPYSLAFMAADLLDDNVTVDKYIGLCQFVIQGDSEILSFSCMEDRYDDEAVIVMLRAVMSFLEKCGVKNCWFLKESVDDRLAKKSGFELKEDRYIIDLEKFYASKCCH